jgi:hypothetical protein
MSAIDASASFPNLLTAPADHAKAITPDNSNDLAYVTRAVILAVAGDLKVDTLGGESGEVLTLPAGPHAIRVKRIYATGTTATGITALW